MSPHLRNRPAGRAVLPEAAETGGGASASNLPSRPNRLGRRGAALTAALGVGALLLAGCGASEGAPVSESEQAESSSGQSPSGPDLPEGWQHVAGEVDFEHIDAETQLPATVTDGTGTETTVHDASRIISAGDGISSTLAALGLQDSIYAAPGNSTAEASLAAPEQFEFSKDTGTEGLLALDGTLFIGDNTKRHGDVAQQFRDAGTDAVVVDDQQTQAEKLQAVADYVGAHEAGEELVDSLESDMEEAQRIVEESDLAGKRVIQVTATGAGGQNSVAGTGTPGTEMIESLGMTSVGAESGLRGFSREFSNEGILSADPEVILMAESDYERWGGEEGFWEAFPTLRDTPAGQEGRIIVMPDAQLCYSSPELGAGAQALAESLSES